MRGLLIALVLPLAAQEKPAATFTVESKLALVSFQVIPKAGVPVPDLRPEDIEIREDGVAQPVALFEGGRRYPRQAPVEIALLFDCSRSVQDAGHLNPHVFDRSLLDEYENASLAVYAFSDKLVRLTPVTRTAAALNAALETVAAFPAGKTPLFEYITATMREFAGDGHTAVRMLMVFSDGESTRPGDEWLDQQAVDAARELGVAIYPVVLSRPGVAGTMERQIESVQKFMGLAKSTGGEATVTLDSGQVLPKLLRAVAGQMQFEYVAGYRPPAGAMRQQHDVEVVWRGKARGEIVGGTRVVVH